MVIRVLFGIATAVLGVVCYFYEDYSPAGSIQPYEIVFEIIYKRDGHFARFSYTAECVTRRMMTWNGAWIKEYAFSPRIKGLKLRNGEQVWLKLPFTCIGGSTPDSAVLPELYHELKQAEERTAIGYLNERAYKSTASQFHLVRYHVKEGPRRTGRHIANGNSFDRIPSFRCFYAVSATLPSRLVPQTRELAGKIGEIEIAQSFSNGLNAWLREQESRLQRYALVIDHSEHVIENTVRTDLPDMAWCIGNEEKLYFPTSAIMKIEGATSAKFGIRPNTDIRAPMHRAVLHGRKLYLLKEACPAWGHIVTREVRPIGANGWPSNSVKLI